MASPMMRRYPLLCAAFTLISIASLVNGQTATPTATVPTMVKFSGTVQGMPSHIIGMTFALYKEQQGGPALWLETQSVSLDASGHYSVQLGRLYPMAFLETALRTPKRVKANTAQPPSPAPRQTIETETKFLAFK